LKWYQYVPFTVGNDLNTDPPMDLHAYSCDTHIIIFFHYFILPSTDELPSYSSSSSCQS